MGSSTLMKSPTIRVSEIFGPTIQGEGPLIGQQTVFVRTGGCDYRCRWCDTLHAVDGAYRDQWVPTSPKAVMREVATLSGGQPLTVSLSGGNPAIQPLEDLIRLGRQDGYRFALETQGSIARGWFEQLDLLTLSPKPPSSGMSPDWNKLDDCLSAAGAQTRTALKIVIFDETDYRFATAVAARYPDLALFLQPGNHTPPDPMTESDAIDITGIMDRMRWLVDRVTADRLYSATVLPQLHTLIWGNLRGV